MSGRFWTGPCRWQRNRLMALGYRVFAVTWDQLEDTAWLRMLAEALATPELSMFLPPPAA